MPDRDFCLWLQEFFELTGATEVTKEQTKMIKEHLALVFNKVTPTLGEETKIEWPPLMPTSIWPQKIEGIPFDHLSRPTIIC